MNSPQTRPFQAPSPVLRGSYIPSLDDALPPAPTSAATRLPSLPTHSKPRQKFPCYILFVVKGQRSSVGVSEVEEPSKDPKASRDSGPG